MVERSLSMREAPGSIPGFSNMKTDLSSLRDLLQFCYAGMILDGSGDGLQIHWSLTWQRFDSSFSATTFVLPVQRSKRPRERRRRMNYNQASSLIVKSGL